MFDEAFALAGRQVARGAVGRFEICLVRAATPGNLEV